MAITLMSAACSTTVAKCFHLKTIAFFLLWSRH